MTISEKPKGLFASIFGTAEEREAKRVQREAARKAALYKHNEAVYAKDPAKRKYDLDALAYDFYLWVPTAAGFHDQITGTEDWMRAKWIDMLDQAGFPIAAEEAFRILQDPMRKVRDTFAAKKRIETFALLLEQRALIQSQINTLQRERDMARARRW